MQPSQTNTEFSNFYHRVIEKLPIENVKSPPPHGLTDLATTTQAVRQQISASTSYNTRLELAHALSLSAVSYLAKAKGHPHFEILESAAKLQIQHWRAFAVRLTDAASQFETLLSNLEPVVDFAGSRLPASKLLLSSGGGRLHREIMAREIERSMLSRPPSRSQITSPDFARNWAKGETDRRDWKFSMRRRELSSSLLPDYFEYAALTIMPPQKARVVVEEVRSFVAIYEEPTAIDELLTVMCQMETSEYVNHSWGSRLLFEFVMFTDERKFVWRRYSSGAMIEHLAEIAEGMLSAAKYANELCYAGDAAAAQETAAKKKPRKSGGRHPDDEVKAARRKIVEINEDKLKRNERPSRAKLTIEVNQRLGTEFTDNEVRHALDAYKKGKLGKWDGSVWRECD